MLILLTMRAINARDTLTKREVEEFNQEKEIAQLQADYQLQFKTKELEIKKLEVKWGQLFRIPFAILSLPVRFLFGIAYIVHAIKGTKPEPSFWEYLSKL